MSVLLSALRRHREPTNDISYTVSENIYRFRDSDRNEMSEVTLKRRGSFARSGARYVKEFSTYHEAPGGFQEVDWQHQSWDEQLFVSVLLQWQDKPDWSVAISRKKTTAESPRQWMNDGFMDLRPSTFGFDLIEYLAERADHLKQRRVDRDGKQYILLSASDEDGDASVLLDPSFEFLAVEFETSGGPGNLLGESRLPVPHGNRTLESYVCNGTIEYGWVDGQRVPVAGTMHNSLNFSDGTGLHYSCQLWRTDIVLRGGSTKLNSLRLPPIPEGTPVQDWDDESQLVPTVWQGGRPVQTMQERLEAIDRSVHQERSKVPPGASVVGREWLPALRYYGTLVLTCIVLIAVLYKLATRTRDTRTPPPT